MTRIAGISGWIEPYAVAVASSVTRAYAAESGGHWYLSTVAADQDAIFALDGDGRLTQTPDVIPGSAGRVWLLGSALRVYVSNLPSTPIAATGYPVLTGSDFTGATAESNANRLEVTSGDLTGVGAAGDTATLVWNAGTDGYEWTG